MVEDSEVPDMGPEGWAAEAPAEAIAAPGGFGGPRGGGYGPRPPRPPRPPMGGGHYGGHRPYRRGGCCGCLLPVMALAGVLAAGIAVLIF